MITVKMHSVRVSCFGFAISSRYLNDDTVCAFTEKELSERCFDEVSFNFRPEK